MTKYLLIVLSVIILAGCSNEVKTEFRKIDLHSGWKVFPSDSVAGGGEVVSSSGQMVNDWYDAQIPSTVMEVLTGNGQYKDILLGENMKEADKSRFNGSWWFHTGFDLSGLSDKNHVLLNFDGISYSANIWLNGKLVASRDSVFGAFRQFTFDITEIAQDKNILAVEVFRAREGDPNIGFVDWNPRPLDESMGIFRGVNVIKTGAVHLSDTHVQSKVNINTLDEAWLTIQTNLQNYTNGTVSGKLVGKIESLEFSYPVTLNSNEKRLISISHSDFPSLHIRDPRLWWCNNFGSPELYNLSLKFVTDDTVQSQEDVTFGIRDIRTYMTERGDKGFILNGKKVLLKGAGWTDDIFLRDTPESNETQVQYVKDMNLNMIRFENIWGTSPNIYDLCDKYGILALVGWSCHWEWEAYYGKPCDDKFGCIQTEEEMALIARSFEDQILWLRNHPSIIAWFVGSDMLPKPELEEKYMEILSRIDNRPYVGAAKHLVSDITGATGMKMAGPYEYVGPNYWYIDTLYGGAFGFNTETGIGAQLPVRESLEKMISADKLWPLNKSWDYHCTTSTSAMNSLNVLNNVISRKYGEAKSLDDYLLKADLLNYDATRAMFEAFRVNMSKTTGITQWMLNSAWPSLYWQLYDYYMIPTSAYYAVKKANMPQQLIYNYGDKSVYVVNESTDKLDGATALIDVYSSGSKLLSRNRLPVSVDANISKKVFGLPETAKNTFVFLNLQDSNNLSIADNYYAVSVKQDEYQWDKTDWVHTPMKAYNDYSSLSDLPEISLDCNIRVNKEQDGTEIEIVLENPGKSIAFFINMKLKDENGEIIYPVFWSDNYVSILPESKLLVSCTVDKKAVLSESLNLVLSGWNVAKKAIEIR